MKSLDISRELNLVLSDDFKQFIDESIFTKYDGCRPRFLVKHWSEEMNFPLCFDPDVVMDVFNNPSIWNKKDPDFASMVPFAVFFNPNTVDELSDMDDFIAIKGDTPETSSIHLWDHEGYFTLVSPSISEFLNSLIAPSDPAWEMES